MYGTRAGTLSDVLCVCHQWYQHNWEKFHFLKKPSASCFHSSGVNELSLPLINIFLAHSITFFSDHYRVIFSDTSESRWQLTWGSDPRASCSRCVVSRNDYGPSSIFHHIFYLDYRGFLEGSRIFFSELNLELIIDAKLTCLSGCNFGLLKMAMCLPSMVPTEFRKVPLLEETICQLRCTLAPLSHLSRPLMSWLMIICCWNTSWWVIAATFCGLSLMREQLLKLICSLLCFHMK